ncbi:DUF2934 domain-containing protein [Mesorhizobium sp.]|uniref:DUF2934 domain-containing protein n=1 Tax=Mesorhizobium sp. TaxID=1871066 RepID=UPI000FE3D7CF|nr:DUF2934 domain-containing protein [Mesorhizobium sp.]RWO02463.1 MAG: DUF2934 domain-containing protein [Mesorhizobium sp.]RWO38473.1 MAG: DUF2934 domain-containing protein [Mesorhizobium sp.]RWO79920.1 MAG: DUF2934 domain-containing protein [Mesorhizobium sp.]TIN22292.1 MAG: DUF2934 domain-containing protein [Mesorhizobium sp.]TIN34234.1 MAG: DUF2934 domain-containing protein [Mesorhizobium sp.]
MSDDKHERIRRRAYEIWEREGQTHGLHERHWNQATLEIENEDRSLGARPPADVPAPAQTQSRGKQGKRAAGQSDVEAAEALAMRTAITGDQAQDLIDRLGDDPLALDEAARSLRASER